MRARRAADDAARAPRSARARAALREAQWTGEREAAASEQRRQDDVDAAIVAEQGRLREARAAVGAYFEDRGGIEVPDEKRATCEACGRRMVVDRAFKSSYVWKCHVPGHPTRPIIFERLLAYVRGLVAE